MISDTLAAVLTRLYLGAHEGLAAACTKALQVDGLALSLVVDGWEPEPLWHFGTASALLEELQFTLGEGPAPDCVRAGVAVTVPDFPATPSVRWPALSTAAAELHLPVRALFCFPLRLGAVRVGVLTMTTDTPGPLTATQTSDALALTAALTAWYLGGHEADLLGAPGTGPAELNRAETHQATGMVSVQLGVPLAEALLRLRARAYSQNRPLHEVAGEVTARRLRFFPDPDAPSAPDNREG
ncbi:GAF and ANTAR domain-containing protein [Streptomyces sp. V4-01]|uniref:GAF and ANTAR domain-containing protein n=1 Tax=Actinacidiphila polyblastidii TaxID=3110430 RepID=A0ABU7PJK9_9ACTN|nr:GAF and ANTAR domain-containing protein [Streptomyces sp. V4-01]